MDAAKQNTQKYLLYKGKPIVRCGNTIYYGSMMDKYVIRIDIKSSQQQSGLEVADKVTIQLLDTNPNLRARKRIVKSSERNGLYSAMDIADAWLSRALS